MPNQTATNAETSIFFYATRHLDQLTINKGGIVGGEGSRAAQNEMKMPAQHAVVIENLKVPIVSANRLIKGKNVSFADARQLAGCITKVSRLINEWADLENKFVPARPMAEEVRVLRERYPELEGLVKEVRNNLERKQRREHRLHPLKERSLSMSTKKILVVDDDADVLECVHETLTRYGYESIPCSDTSSALTMLASGASLDLAIIDLIMPEMDGLEFHAKLKHLRPGLPCILATGYGSVEAYLNAMNSGVFDYLYKPYRCSDLITAVEAALKKSATMNGGD